MEERICPICNVPLDPEAHGNRRMHPECAYAHKKEQQKNKYIIGNKAKLMIQKNEKVAAQLHMMDPDKKGIPYLKVLGHGFSFDCPTVKLALRSKTIYLMDQFGYYIEGNSIHAIIIFYHVSELR